ncbi:TspO/MBR family protein [Mesonia aquimarina]|uniref:TspO/MBR family protein n=1 Tax=Mesonia aquimarina TaxID=1504967 RepID=UPI000EF57EFA|nr:TspO/MBR family protein [Mesonia aquimarina]
MSQKTALYKITGTVFIGLLIGFFCMIAITESAGNWLKIINKPDFFLSIKFYALAWGLSFCLLGLSAGIVWSKGFYHSWVKTALYHFGFLILLNALWFILFLELKLLLIALLFISGLFIFLLFTIKWFKVTNNWSAYLLFPYVFWVAYNVILTFEIWRLN